MTEDTKIPDFETRARLMAKLADPFAVEVGWRDEFRRLVGHTRKTLDDGGKLIFVGNGGSAALGQHLACELVVRFRRPERPGQDSAPLPAIAIPTDVVVASAAVNDMGADSLMLRQLQALAHANDMLVLLTTSGKSHNLIECARWAASLRIFVAVLAGKDAGWLRGGTNCCVEVPSADTALIQEAHLMLGHMLCEQLEDMR